MSAWPLTSSERNRQGSLTSWYPDRGYLAGSTFVQLMSDSRAPTRHVSLAIVSAALVTLTTLVSCANTSALPQPLSDEDRRAIRANDSTYVSAWLRD